MKNLRQSFVACSTPFLHRIIVGPAAQAGVSHGDRAPLGFVFRRLLDMVHNDASGVSALQHFLSSDSFLRLALRSGAGESDAPDP